MEPKMINDPSRVLPGTAAAMVWLGFDPSSTNTLNEYKDRIFDALRYLDQAAECGEIRYYDRRLLQEIPVGSSGSTEKVFAYSFTIQSLMDFAKCKSHDLKLFSEDESVNTNVNVSGVNSLSVAPQMLSSNSDRTLPRQGTLWPNHETTKLSALRMAAVRFWTNYDPQTPGTAPKNVDVVDWLIKEHNIAPTVAEQMASILRPDNLKPGPR